MKRKDLILLLSAIGVAVAFMAVFAAIGLHKGGDAVVISIDGQIIERLPLKKDTEYKIETPEGGYNLLVIEDGRAYVKEASCPDKICVKTGGANEISPIVCLPNKVVISIEKE